MSSFPNFSNISQYITDEFTNRRNNPLELSKLNCWTRISSAVDNGLIITSNPNYKLFAAAGQNQASIYGSTSSSGTIGIDWNKTPINASNDTQIGLPQPIISSFEVDEGSGNISRKASISIIAYTRKQLDIVTKYFLEPGFTVFLEWGWNTQSGVSVLDTITVPYVTKIMEAKTLSDIRSKTNGHYESYLGFITGGSISFNGNAWVVSVSLTGFTELPTYLNSTDKITNETDTTTNSVNAAVKYGTLWSEADLGKKRFKQMFNELPSIRRTKQIQTFINDILIANPVNYINFDETVRDKVNDNSGGLQILGWTIDKDTVKGVEVPAGTKIIGDERFIRFGTLMKIINVFGLAESYKVGDKYVKLQINTEYTPVTAFRSIFSTEKTKLVIPNPKTPDFSLIEASVSGSVGVSTETNDCSIKSGNIHIQFPQQTHIRNGKVVGDVVLFYNNDDSIVKFNKDAGEWGYLDDLYVNFDFATDILDTSKLSVKDALYQILNGMSSAVNGLWDFQIQEIPKADATGLVELRVVDTNLVGIDTVVDPTELTIYGVNSIFTDASFDMDIGGAMMNQIIGKRLSTSTNESNPTTAGKLFASGYTDKVLNTIQKRTEENANSNSSISSEAPSSDEMEEMQTKNIEDYIAKVGIYPNVNIGSGRAGSVKLSNDTNNNVYYMSYDDKQLFNSYKVAADLDSGDNVSILLPIKFSFTVHGISGIRRGDKFVVNGLPDKYGKENGFFQVLAIKHTVDGMMWKTTVDSGFRQKRK